MVRKLGRALLALAAVGMAYPGVAFAAETIAKAAACCGCCCPTCCG